MAFDDAELARDLSHDAQCGALVAHPTVAKERQKLDEGARFRRNVLVADSAILLRRAHEAASVPMIRTAERAGVSHQLVTGWTTDPLHRPPPLYSVIAHPAVTVEAAALLLERVADQLDAAPVDIGHAGVGRVHAALARLDAAMARRAR